MTLILSTFEQHTWGISQPPHSSQINFMAFRASTTLKLNQVMQTAWLVRHRCMELTSEGVNESTKAVGGVYAVSFNDHRDSAQLAVRLR